jgi:hypothetical protein
MVRATAASRIMAGSLHGITYLDIGALDLNVNWSPHSTLLSDPVPNVQC